MEPRIMKIIENNHSEKVKNLEYKSCVTGLKISKQVFKNLPNGTRVTTRVAISASETTPNS